MTPFSWGVVWALTAAIPMAFLWGYQVDDALVTARVAHQLATGYGYRFNADGPVVDAVTPFGWVYCLAPFAARHVLGAFRAARWFGALAWAIGAGLLGYRIAVLRGRRWAHLVGATLLVQAPLAAWAVSGMETGVVTLLATLALAEGRWALFWAGSAAAWRPELLPWALTLAAGSALARTRRPLPALVAVLLVAGPSVLVASLRFGMFGMPVPLAVWAKPSDLRHGLYYALGAGLDTGLPVLVLAPWVWRRLSGHEWAIMAAFLVHLGSVGLVGGDWMALYRLVVPVLPGLLLVGAAVVDQAAAWASTVRVLLALALSARLMLAKGPRARQVEAERARVMAELGPSLARTERVAAVDIGWVGATTEAHVVDLAGITDPSVATLPGGHTSKRIPEGFLRNRRVDHLVLLLRPGAPLAEPWPDSALRGYVEVLALRQAREIGYSVVATAPLGQSGNYLVLRLKEGG